MYLLHYNRCKPPTRCGRLLWPQKEPEVYKDYNEINTYILCSLAGFILMVKHQCMIIKCLNYLNIYQKPDTPIAF